MKLLSFLLIQFALLFSLPAQAAGDPYDQARFDRLIKSGKPVAVMILTGLDKRLEKQLLDMTPDGLLFITTSL